MAKGTTTDNDVLKAILKGTDPSWRTNANLYLALHTADPGAVGAQNTYETQYSNYARKAVAKASDWSDAGVSFSNANILQFNQAGAALSSIVSYVSLGTAISGAGQILYVGALTDSLTVTNLIQPQFGIGALVITEN